jgi:SWI/SNF related-matrix-associated actin-dependent regulator of chromatin subfamily C
VTADTPRGLQPFQPGPNTFTTPGKPHSSTDRAVSATPAVKSDLNLEIRRNIFDDKGKEITPTDEKEKQINGDGATTNGTSSGTAATKAMDDAAKEPKKTFNCYSCGIDCTRLRFHYAKHDPSTASSTTPEVKYDLCPNCYFQGRMPSSHRSSDFVKLEEPAYSTIPDRDAPWTDSETLLLLEGLEQFDENWTAVANHVGTRTREECVMKFLQLEIQDKYLEDEPEHGSATLQALRGRDPISQSENPVMSVVAFLAQMADPAVVAAAAGRSVEAMNKELSGELEKGMGGSASEKGKQKEVVKSEDSMDVDGQTEAAAAASNGASNPAASLATVGLASAAARAGALASHEEREMTRLVGAAVNLTLQKFELKLAQFAEMEEIVQAERRDLEKGRQQLFLDRMAFKKRVKDFEDALRSASLKEPQEAMRMMQEAVGSGTGKKFAFQAANGTAMNGIGPLSAEGGDFKSIDI